MAASIRWSDAVTIPGLKEQYTQTDGCILHILQWAQLFHADMLPAFAEDRRFSTAAKGCLLFQDSPAQYDVEQVHV